MVKPCETCQGEIPQRRVDHTFGRVPRFCSDECNRKYNMRTENKKKQKAVKLYRYMERRCPVALDKLLTAIGESR